MEPIENIQYSAYALQLYGPDEELSEVQASWRSLFSFTTQRDTSSIALALVATITSALLKPAAAVFFGKIFSILTQFGARSLSTGDTLHQISLWCTALAILGGAAWLVEWIFLYTWVVFGELQAKTVRNQMFTGMLDKEIEWYDLRQDGIGTLLIRIQT